MSYAGYTALLYAAVVDVLKSAAPSLTPAVDPLRVFQVTGQEANAELPWIAARLPIDYGNSTWVGTGNLQDNLYRVEVGVAAELIGDGNGTHPYGDASTPGPLTLIDSVQDALENARATFLAATPRLVDYSVSAQAFQKQDGTRVVFGTITITFKVRFRAGNR